MRTAVGSWRFPSCHRHHHRLRCQWILFYIQLGLRNQKKNRENHNGNEGQNGKKTENEIRQVNKQHQIRNNKHLFILVFARSVHTYMAAAHMQKCTGVGGKRRRRRKRGDATTTTAAVAGKNTLWLFLLLLIHICWALFSAQLLHSSSQFAFSLHLIYECCLLRARILNIGS